jgi:phosphoribosylaminoimidazole carboxylase (NCAIR synthetase)
MLANRWCFFGKNESLRVKANQVFQKRFLDHCFVFIDRYFTVENKHETNDFAHWHNSPEVSFTSDTKCT